MHFSSRMRAAYPDQAGGSPIVASLWLLVGRLLHLEIYYWQS